MSGLISIRPVDFYSRVSRTLLDQWVLQEDTMWNAFPRMETQPANLTRRTSPKPDLTYGFPILRETSDRSKGLNRDEFTQLMSITTLANLQKEGFVCSPTTGLNNWTGSNDTTLTTADLSCFPWAVVEMKKWVDAPDTRIERCYCQAANAAAAALTIRERFAAKAMIRFAIPPVVSFTCIGPKVKVWLSYRDTQASGDTRQQMICIWSTTLELTWGVVALRAIVKNLHTWSSRVLKLHVLHRVHQAWERLKAPLIQHPGVAISPSQDRPWDSGALALFTSVQVMTFDDSLRILEKAMRMNGITRSLPPIASPLRNRRIANLRSRIFPSKFISSLAAEISDSFTEESSACDNEDYTAEKSPEETLSGSIMPEPLDNVAGTQLIAGGDSLD
ncbi:hypothetical protein K469DRAFT_200524 [Zopfia rhizophila CBS 207.26]|uniref:Uncharacterized protein n=1 Tax=Zopfia rhizophila CBS 207.26 TaxID=1314779 RepID=A0A6A6DX60_9PEZI|nr:hypothetical protein K469DRAFT_200524 [Zopfia rhizophila CBS 207.26]